MKIWTYRESTPQQPYWQVQGESTCLLEYPNRKFEWRWVTNGKYVGSWAPPQSNICDFKGKLLERKYWPQWALDADEYYVDEGL